MKIAVGCDHGGINLKPVLLDHLTKRGFEFIDFGTFDKASVDYNDYAEKVCDSVVKKRVRPWYFDLWHRYRYEHCGKQN